MNKIRKVRGLLVKSGRDQRNALTPAPLDWQAIRWRSAHKRVSQLRRRIFRAAQGGAEKLSNLCLLHETCHHQVHGRNGKEIRLRRVA